MDGLPEVKESEFDAEVLKAALPVVVDFSATWCGPCKQMAPFLVELSKEYDGKVKVVSVNIDDSQGTAVKFGVTAVPTLVFMKGGKEIARTVGYMPKPGVAKNIQKLLT